MKMNKIEQPARREGKSRCLFVIVCLHIAIEHGSGACVWVLGWEMPPFNVVSCHRVYARGVFFVQLLLFTLLLFRNQITASRG